MSINSTCLRLLLGMSTSCAVPLESFDEEKLVSWLDVHSYRDWRTCMKQENDSLPEISTDLNSEMSFSILGTESLSHKSPLNNKRDVEYPIPKYIDYTTTKQKNYENKAITKTIRKDVETGKKELVGLWIEDDSCNSYYQMWTATPCSKKQCIVYPKPQPFTATGAPTDETTIEIHLLN